MVPVLTSLASGALSFIYPPHCEACGLAVAELERVLCTSCANQVVLCGRDYCHRCGAILGPHVGAVAGCPSCDQHPENWRFTTVAAAGNYEGALRELVLLLKFGKRQSLAKPLGLWLAQVCISRGVNADLVCPVPLSRKRLLERGYNQSALLARSLAEAMHLPCDHRLLRRSRHSRPQVALTESERAENVRGAFSVKDRGGHLRGKSVLLVDDVLTTGATLRSAASALRKAGAAFISVAVVARTRHGARDE